MADARADGGASAGTSGDLIASEDELMAFVRDAVPKLNDKLSGVLIEAGMKGVLRYKWELMKPLVACAMDKALLEYLPEQDAAERAVEVGPQPEVMGPEDKAQWLVGLHALLDAFPTDAPFTIQRVCELLSHPRASYHKPQELVWALSKCLRVTGTRAVDAQPPSRAALSELERCFEESVTLRSAASPLPDKTNGIASSPAPASVEVAPAAAPTDSAAFMLVKEATMVKDHTVTSPPKSDLLASADERERAALAGAAQSPKKKHKPGSE